MRNNLFSQFRLFFLLLISCCSLSCNQLQDHSSSDDRSSQLREMYDLHCQNPSDINEHIPVLRQLAKECSSVVEIGVRNIVSTWGILSGLAENSYVEKTYLGIDLKYPPDDRLQHAEQLAEDNGINFIFLCSNDMQIQIEPVDMLFIDSLHTYCHLTYELETFSSNVRKYICMHDTSDPCGERDDSEYCGDYSEYPDSYDRTKRGLWPAVLDFLKSHPEWSLVERRTNNHGFTILKRVSESAPASL